MVISVPQTDAKVAYRLRTSPQQYSCRPCCSKACVSTAVETNAAWRYRKKNMLAQLARTHIDRVALQLIWWLDWRNGAVGLERSKKDFWSRLAKSLHSQKLSVAWAGKMDQKLASMLVPEKMSWSTATRSIRKCRTQIEKIGGSRVDTKSTARGRDAQVWNLFWMGEEAVK